MVAGILAASTAVVSLMLLFAAPRLPSLPRHPDRAALRVVAPNWSLARWEVLRFSAALIAFAVVGRGAVVVALFALVLPSLGLRWRVHVLRRRATAACVPILQATHAALRSGMPIAAALRAALGPHPPIARAPFDAAMRAFDLNAQLDDSLEAARRTAADRSVMTALDALALAASEDLPAARAAALVASVAERLTFESQLRDEIEARSSGARTQIVILALVVPCFAAYLAATMPGLAATLTSPIGVRLLLPAALVLEIVGIVASRLVVAGLDL